MTLFLQYDDPSDRYEIWVADDRMSPMPAGGGGLWKFSHATHQEAETDRIKAQAYLDGLRPEKLSKKEMREAGV